MTIVNRLPNGAMTEGKDKKLCLSILLQNERNHQLK